MKTSLPKKQGLYDPWFEHDACGVGVVDIDPATIVKAAQQQLC